MNIFLVTYDLDGAKPKEQTQFKNKIESLYNQDKTEGNIPDSTIIIQNKDYSTAKDLKSSIIVTSKKNGYNIDKLIVAKIEKKDLAIM